MNVCFCLGVLLHELAPTLFQFVFLERKTVWPRTPPPRVLSEGGSWSLVSSNKSHHRNGMARLCSRFNQTARPKTESKAVCLDPQTSCFEPPDFLFGLGGHGLRVRLVPSLVLHLQHGVSGQVGCCGVSLYRQLTVILKWIFLDQVFLYKTRKKTNKTPQDIYNED